MLDLANKTKKPLELRESLGGKFKFIFWVAGVLIFILSILGFFLIKSQSLIFKKEVEDKGRLLVEFVSKIVATPALYGDQLELERIVKEVVKGKEEVIDYMVIFDNEGKPLTFSSKKPEKIDPEKTLIISAPILEDFGYIEIGYSLLPLQRTQIYLILNILIAIALSILFSAAGIIFISRKLIIQPAEKVAQINIQLKELTEELDKKVKERTAELEEERASLAIKIQARTKEVKELAESLEERVKKRTKELEESRRSLINMLEDVEEARRGAEEERDKTKAIVTNLADGLLVFDKDGILSLVNPQAEIFFNIKTKEIIGKSILELAQFPDFNSLVNLLGKEFRKVYREELQIKENLTLEVSTLPMISGKEKLGTVVVLHDVTREKMVERMKTEFVSLVAHQLRTPLSAIKWTLRMLLDGDLGKITEEQRGFIEKTYGSNERMIALINDLLDVTRIEEGRYLSKPTLTDLEELLKKVVESYQEEAKRKKLNLEFQKPKAKLPKVLVDIEKMELALQNLVENAVRYTPERGRVTISLKLAKKELEFSIKDTGMGIPEDQKNRVFTKFFRGANVIRTETEGTGLGLFITKNIIESHHGKIWFESEEGKGSTFHFTLPVKK